MDVSCLITHAGYENQRSDSRNSVPGRTNASEKEGSFSHPISSPLEHYSRPELSCDREALFAEFEPLVRRLVRRFGNTEELRRDLPGEIYCRFCAFVDAFDPTRGIPLRPYLVRQLSAATFTYVRRHWRTACREVAIEEVQVNCGFGWEEDPTTEWIQDLSQQQVAKRLPGAIDRLPRRQRQVVIWRYYEERSFESIAEVMGVKHATVRSLLRHGLNNLRKHMETTGCENLD